MNQLSDHSPDCDCGRAPPLDSRRCECGESLDVLRRISEAALAGLSHKSVVRLPVGLVDEPANSGFMRSRLGKRKGQEADYRMRAAELADGDGRELHLREYDDEYTLHWDAYPARSPMHAVKDAPDYGAACVAGAALVGAAAVSAWRRRGRSRHDEETADG